jgi:hypothetical protein
VLQPLSGGGLRRDIPPAPVAHGQHPHIQSMLPLNVTIVPVGRCKAKHKLVGHIRVTTAAYCVAIEHMFRKTFLTCATAKENLFMSLVAPGVV